MSLVTVLVVSHILAVDSVLVAPCILVGYTALVFNDSSCCQVKFTSLISLRVQVVLAAQIFNLQHSHPFRVPLPLLLTFEETMTHFRPELQQGLLSALEWNQDDTARLRDWIRSSYMSRHWDDYIVRGYIPEGSISLENFVLQIVRKSVYFNNTEPKSAEEFIDRMIERCEPQWPLEQSAMGKYIPVVAEYGPRPADDHSARFITGVVNDSSFEGRIWSGTQSTYIKKHSLIALLLLV
jgi:hypothetical protein